MSATEVLVRGCRKCDRPLLRNHDEWFCLVHGLMVDPMRAGDLVAPDSLVEADRIAITDLPARGATPHRAAWKLTEEEREAVTTGRTSLDVTTWDRRAHDASFGKPSRSAVYCGCEGVRRVCNSCLEASRAATRERNARIRAAYVGGERRATVLAARFRVSRQTIYTILNGGPASLRQGHGARQRKGTL